VEVLGRSARECPDLTGNLNNYAWALATLPDDTLRDGPKAVEVARAALTQMGERDPAFLDTLAAAHLEAGEYEAAERIALEGLGIIEKMRAPDPVIEIFRSHLAAIRARQPIRDPEGS
jgi:hypothetical protein